MKKIAFLQNNPVFGEKEKNFSETEKLLGSTKADLIVLPELFATGYTITSKEEALLLAESTGGETAAFLCALSRKSGASVIAGFIEKEEDRMYNSALIIQEGKVTDTYRKLHLFNQEKLWFSPGDKPLRVYDLNGIRTGVMICFDWIFPEAARTLALQGAQLIAHPANLVLPFGQAAMITRCIENRVFAVTANRIGREQRGGGDLTFTGGSQIIDCGGKVLCSASADLAEIGQFEINPTDADQKMITDLNDVIRDRRIEFYSA